MDSGPIRKFSHIRVGFEPPEPTRVWLNFRMGPESIHNANPYAGYCPGDEINAVRMWVWRVVGL